jgi:flagellar export protein FliJ
MISLFAAYVSELDGEIADVSTRIAELEKARKEKYDALVEAMQERKKVEIIKERNEERLIFEQMQKERKHLDDIAGLYHRRKT